MIHRPKRPPQSASDRVAAHVARRIADGGARLPHALIADPALAEEARRLIELHGSWVAAVRALLSQSIAGK